MRTHSGNGYFRKTGNGRNGRTLSLLGQISHHGASGASSHRSKGTSGHYSGSQKHDTSYSNKRLPGSVVHVKSSAGVGGGGAGHKGRYLSRPKSASDHWNSRGRFSSGLTVGQRTDYDVRSGGLVNAASLVDAMQQRRRSSTGGSKAGNRRGDVSGSNGIGPFVSDEHNLHRHNHQKRPSTAQGYASASSRSSMARGDVSASSEANGLQFNITGRRAIRARGGEGAGRSRGRGRGRDNVSSSSQPQPPYLLGPGQGLLPDSLSSGGETISHRRGFASSVPTNPTRQQHQLALQRHQQNQQQRMNSNKKHQLHQQTDDRHASGPSQNPSKSGDEASGRDDRSQEEGEGSGGNQEDSGSGAKGGPTPSNHSSNQRTGAPEDLAKGCVFTQSPNYPGVPIVYRTAAQRAENSERLNLDRINLSTMPLLEGEHRLRLLNYQNNMLRKICHLQGLPNLIFLDLYNNRIERIEGLACVPALRVLMLGKNAIRNVENLEPLRKLDVLDLHSNKITKIQRLSHLAELRVLNLAGNAIDLVDNLAGLRSLTELNLRRNKIERVLDLDTLPALQRIFLSHNDISNFDHIGCVFRSKSLSELALSHNPVVMTLTSNVEAQVDKEQERTKQGQEKPRQRRNEEIDQVHGAGQDAEGKVRKGDFEGLGKDSSEGQDVDVDGSKIVEDAKRREEEKRQAEAEALRAYKHHIIASLPQLTHLDLHRISDNDRKTAAAMASRREERIKLETRQRHARGQRGMAISRARATWNARLAEREKERRLAERHKGGDEEELHVDVGVPVNEGVALGHWDKTMGSQSNSSGNNSWYSEVEVHGGSQRLCLYGTNFDSLENAKLQRSVEEISFCYVDFEDAVCKTLNILKAFQRLRKIMLTHNGLDSFKSLDALRHLVVKMSLLRAYVAYRLRNIAVLNGIRVTDAERLKGHRIFSNTKIFAVTAKKSSSAANKERQAAFSTAFTRALIEQASEIEKKIENVDDMWPGLVKRIIHDTLGGIARRKKAVTEARNRRASGTNMQNSKMASNTRASKN